MSKLKNISDQILVGTKFIEVGKSAKLDELKIKVNRAKTEQDVGDTIKTVTTQYYVSLSCDELAEGTWTETKPETYTGYLWERTKYVKGSGQVTYSSPSYQFKSEDAPKTQILQIVCEKETYDRNDRTSGSQTITFKLTVSGYETNTATVIATGSNGTVYKTVLNMETGSDSFNMPYANCPDTVTITATQSLLNVASTTITAINKTGEPMYLGELSALPDASSTPKVPADYAYDYFIVGDYFSCTTTNAQAGITAGIPYEFNGITWSAMQFATREQKTKAFICLAGMLNSEVAIPSSTTLYAWIGTLVAQDASIASLFAQIIEVGNAIYGGDVNLNGEIGERVTGTGFIMDSNGVMEISRGYASDMDISGIISIDHEYVKSGVFRSDRFYPQIF